MRQQGGRRSAESGGSNVFSPQLARKSYLREESSMTKNSERAIDAKLTRRAFVGAAAATAAVGLAGCAPKTGTEKEMPATGASTSDISWDEECEVLVVGSGYSGLAAAIEAKNAGADVKIIEKMNRVGGNSAFAAGDMAVCSSKV